MNLTTYTIIADLGFSHFPLFEKEILHGIKKNRNNGESSMSYDINWLDKIEYDGSSESEEALDKYQNFILEEFSLSAEGKAHIKVDPEMGFWITQLIYYGFAYIGVTLPQMNEQDINEITTDLFPSKISLGSPEDADNTIPELLAFWQFLRSKYKLSNADSIIDFLVKIKPKFNAIMNDSSRFGMAKSFMTMGQKAGFDMTDQNQMNEFVQIYNENIMEGSSDIPSTRKVLDFTSDNTHSEKAKGKKKQKRKMAKASRKKNKKKRKR